MLKFVIFRFFVPTRALSINTTRQTGGLHRGYKPCYLPASQGAGFHFVQALLFLLPWRASKEARFCANFIRLFVPSRAQVEGSLRFGRDDKIGNRDDSAVCREHRTLQIERSGTGAGAPPSTPLSTLHTPPSKRLLCITFVAHPHSGWLFVPRGGTV